MQFYDHPCPVISRSKNDSSKSLKVNQKISTDRNVPGTRVTVPRVLSNLSNLTRTPRRSQEKFLSPIRFRYNPVEKRKPVPKTKTKPPHLSRQDRMLSQLVPAQVRSENPRRKQNCDVNIEAKQSPKSSMTPRSRLSLALSLPRLRFSKIKSQFQKVLLTATGLRGGTAAGTGSKAGIKSDGLCSGGG